MEEAYIYLALDDEIPLLDSVRFSLKESSQDGMFRSDTYTRNINQDGAISEVLVIFALRGRKKRIHTIQIRRKADDGMETMSSLNPGSTTLNISSSPIEVEMEETEGEERIEELGDKMETEHMDEMEL